MSLTNLGPTNPTNLCAPFRCCSKNLGLSEQEALQHATQHNQLNPPNRLVCSAQMSLKDLGLSEQEALLDVVDKNNDGRIDYEEFVHMMR